MTSLISLSCITTLVFLIIFAYYLDAWEKSRGQAWYTNDATRTRDLAIGTILIGLMDIALISAAILFTI